MNIEDYLDDFEEETGFDLTSEEEVKIEAESEGGRCEGDGDICPDCLK